MVDYIEWVDFHRAVNSFVNFLNLADAFNSYHVIFSMGTIVRIDRDESNTEFIGYTGEYVEDYPIYRISIDLDEIIADNIAVWESQKDVPVYGRFIRSGYHSLISNGYVTATTDKVPVPCQDPSAHDDILWNVLWPELSPNVTNLVISSSDDPVSAAVIGAELRRYDYMFPNVRALITPDLDIIYI
jgi:hypothetical protein